MPGDRGAGRSQPMRARPALIAEPAEGGGRHLTPLRLAKAKFCGQPERIMARLLPKHVFALLLAVFLTAGFSLSAAQASIMSAKMMMTTGGGMAVPADTSMAKMADTGMNGDCNACLKGAGDTGKPMHCPPTCIAPVLAVLPFEFAAMTVTRAPLPSALPTPFLHGRSSLPEPFPPKSTDLV